MKRLFFTLINILFLFLFVPAQNPGIISGPMLGPVELRDAKIWIEVSPDVKDVVLQYIKKGFAKTINRIKYKGELGKPFNPIQLTIGGLDFNTAYEYQILVNGKATPAKGDILINEILNLEFSI